uniref:Single-stranded DNA-binding protein 2 n=1 Tax=Sphaeramia orbicularis TaxID=375764 RepID=A0A673CDP9_9TELE
MVWADTEKKHRDTDVLALCAHCSHIIIYSINGRCELSHNARCPVFTPNELEACVRRSTMLQEADRGSARMCQCRLLGQTQQKHKSAAAAPSPVLGNLPPGEGMPVGPVPPGFFQPFMSPRYPGGPRPPLRLPSQGLGGVPGSQPMLPSGMDPTRQQGHPNMGGPMQRMTPPRGMVPLGPQNYGGGMRPPLNALVGPGMPGMNMGPGGGRPWPNPPNANSTPYSSASPGSYVGPPGGGGPPGTPIMPSPADSTNSGDNMYTMINTVPPGGNRPSFPMGAGGDGPLGGMAGMESHHLNGSLGSGDMDSLPKNSPGNLSMSNQPGTPREDGEMGGNFLNPFQNESVSQALSRRQKKTVKCPHTVRKHQVSLIKSVDNVYI